MDEKYSLVKTGNPNSRIAVDKDYTMDLESMAVSLVDTIFKIGKPKIDLRKFRIEITPSVDSGIGPHFDADVYSEIQGKYEFISHATLLSDHLGDCKEKRAGYLRALTEGDGPLDFSMGPIDYSIVLKKEVTYSDSNLLGKMLEAALTRR
jgi:hypothetical protein